MQKKKELWMNELNLALSNSKYDRKVFLCDDYEERQQRNPKKIL